MPQPAGAGRPAVSCAWTRTACLSGRLSVSRDQSALPYLLLLSRPRHTSSLSSSHALSSTLRRKTLSRLLSASPISTQKGLSCPRYTRYRLLNPSRSHSDPYNFPPQTRKRLSLTADGVLGERVGFRVQIRGMGTGKSGAMSSIRTVIGRTPSPWMMRMERPRQPLTGCYASCCSSQDG
jgi:hypothetical protein